MVHKLNLTEAQRLSFICMLFVTAFVQQHSWVVVTAQMVPKTSNLFSVLLHVMFAILYLE